jgi:hypothetical protein
MSPSGYPRAGLLSGRAGFRGDKHFSSIWNKIRALDLRFGGLFDRQRWSTAQAIEGYVMKRAALLVFSVLFLAVTGFASVTGSIAGIVRDQTGTVIPGLQSWL